MGPRKLPPVTRRRIIERDENSSESEEDLPAKEPTFRKPRTPPSSSRGRVGKAGRGGSQASQSQATPGPSTSQSQKSSQNKSQKKKQSQQEDDSSSGEDAVVYDFTDARALSEEDMVKNAIYYFLMLQGKKHPIRKSDIIKIAFNNQSRAFREVIVQVSEALSDTFGIKLIGMKNGPDGCFVTCGVVDASNFMITSKFRGTIATLVEPDQPFKKDLAKAALLLILACTYMSDRSLDEDGVWSILESMGFAQQLCKKREDLRRFLKTEYVDSLYLTKQEIKDTDQVTVRYGWGVRSEQEISKYAVLKFVSGQLSGKKPRDFPTLFSKIQKKEMLEVDAEDDRLKQGPGLMSKPSGDDSGENQDSDSGGEVYIDAEVPSGSKQGERKATSSSSSSGSESTDEDFTKKSGRNRHSKIISEDPDSDSEDE